MNSFSLRRLDPPRHRGDLAARLDVGGVGIRPREQADGHRPTPARRHVRRADAPRAAGIDQGEQRRAGRQGDAVVALGAAESAAAGRNPPLADAIVSLDLPPGLRGRTERSQPGTSRARYGAGVVGHEQATCPQSAQTRAGPAACRRGGPAREHAHAELRGRRRPGAVASRRTVRSAARCGRSRPACLARAPPGLSRQVAVGRSWRRTPSRTCSGSRPLCRIWGTAWAMRDPPRSTCSKRGDERAAELHRHGAVARIEGRRRAHQPLAPPTGTRAGARPRRRDRGACGR